MKKGNKVVLLAVFFVAVGLTFSSGLAGRQLNGLGYTSYLPLIAKPPDLQWIGPDGGSIVCLAISPSQPNIMYAGTWGAGVHRSTDGGVTWSQVSTGLPNMQINAIGVDPKNPDVVYAGPYRYQLYKSIDGGQSWFLASAGIQPQAIVYSVAVDPVNTDKVYIATRGISNNGQPPWNGRIYRSTDGGASWIESLIDVGGSSAQDWAYSLAVNPTSPNIVYAALHEHGVYKSFNAGISWSPVNNGIYPENDKGMISGRSIIIDPSNVSQLFFGVWHGDGVYRSDNGASSWARYNEGSIAGSAIYNMAIDPSNSNIVYVATFSFDGVLKSSNDGQYIWRPAGLAQDQIYSVAVNPQTPSTVYAGTYGAGLYRSTNGALSWSQSHKGITNTSVKDLVVMPDGSIISAITNAGLSRLLSPGQNWEAFNWNLPDRVVNDLVRSPANPNLIFAATNSAGLYYFDISASSQWTKTGLNLNAPGLQAPLYTPEHPFATREDLEAEVGDLMLRETLRLPLAVDASAPISSMTYAQADANIAYLGVYAVDNTNVGVYRSTNGGLNWSNFGLGNRNVIDLAVHPLDSNMAYALTTSGGSVFYSEVKPEYPYVTWYETYTPIYAPYSIATLKENPDRIFVGSNDGVYVGSLNGGWTRLGLAGIAVTALETDPGLPNRIYAGTNQGVYVSFDAGQTWELNPFFTTDTIQSISFDINDPHIVFIGTLTRGAARFIYP